MKKLTPPDRKQCQAERRTATFLSLGGDCMKLIRCKNKPIVIAKENKPGADGQRGSMSLCRSCLGILVQQLGANYCAFIPITTHTIPSMTVRKRK